MPWTNLVCTRHIYDVRNRWIASQDRLLRWFNQELMSECLCGTELCRANLVRVLHDHRLLDQLGIFPIDAFQTSLPFLKIIVVSRHCGSRFWFVAPTTMISVRVRLRIHCKNFRIVPLPARSFFEVSHACQPAAHALTKNSICARFPMKILMRDHFSVFPP